MQLKIIQNYISPFVASFSHLALFQKSFWRTTDVHNCLFYSIFPRFALMQATPYFAQFQQELGNTAAPMLEVMKNKTAPRPDLCNLPKTLPLELNPRFRWEERECPVCSTYRRAERDKSHLLVSVNRTAAIDSDRSFRSLGDKGQMERQPSQWSFTLKEGGSGSVFGMGSGGGEGGGGGGDGDSAS